VKVSRLQILQLQIAARFHSKTLCLTKVLIDIKRLFSNITAMGGYHKQDVLLDICLLYQAAYGRKVSKLRQKAIKKSKFYDRATL